MNPPAVQQVPALLRWLRFLPLALPGRWRIAHALMSRLLDDGPADISANGITFRVPSTREPVAMHLIADGCYEGPLCAVLAERLGPRSVFFDVGANVGAISLVAAHHWCPQGKVLGFEASPHIYSFLEHNARMNPTPNLQVLNRAVTAQSGERLTFYDAPTEKFGMGSLANRFQSEGTDVLTISLDDAARELGIEHVDVIKVDVEGFELGVLKGAERLLRHEQAPFIAFEFNDWAEANSISRPGDAQRFLRSLGFVTLPMQAWLRGERGTTPVIELGSADLIAFKP